MNCFNKIIIICGHYGCGKTTVALNLAMLLKSTVQKVTVIDMDIVNPYFRSSDYSNMLKAANIDIVAPGFAGTTLDVPSLTPGVAGAISGDSDYVIIDVGGDDAGATALGCFFEKIEALGYTMLYVINRNRPMVASARGAADILGEIELSSKLKATGIINNTHLCSLTDNDMITNSIEYAQEVSSLCNLPIIYNSYNKQLKPANIHSNLMLDIMVTPPWDGSLPID